MANVRDILNDYNKQSQKKEATTSKTNVKHNSVAGVSSDTTNDYQYESNSNKTTVRKLLNNYKKGKVDIDTSGYQGIETRTVNAKAIDGALNMAKGNKVSDEQKQKYSRDYASKVSNGQATDYSKMNTAELTGMGVRGLKTALNNKVREAYTKATGQETETNEEYLEKQKKIVDMYDDNTKALAEKYTALKKERDAQAKAQSYAGGGTNTAISNLAKYDEELLAMKKELSAAGLDDTKVNQLLDAQSWVANAQQRETSQKEIKDATYVDYKNGEKLTAGKAANKVLANVGDIAVNQFAALNSAGEIVLNYLNGKRTDTNSDNFALVNFQNDVEQTQQENNSNYWQNKTGKEGSFGEKASNFMYGAGMSTAKSMVSAATGGALTNALGYTGKTAQVVGNMITLPSFGQQAFTQSYTDAMERGLDQDHAMKTALVSGLAEMGTEIVSLDKLWSVYEKSGGAAAKNLILNGLVQAGIEGSEEGVNDIINEIADLAINGDKSEYANTVNAYMNNGYSREEAESYASKEFWSQTFEDFLAGAVSGGISGAAATVAGAYSNNKTGKNIKGNEEAYAYAISDNRSDYETDEDYEQAQQAILNVIDSEGKETTGREAYKLGKQVNEALQNQTSTIEDNYDRAITESTKRSALNEVRTATTPEQLADVEERINASNLKEDNEVQTAVQNQESRMMAAGVTATDFDSARANTHEGIQARVDSGELNADNLDTVPEDKRQYATAAVEKKQLDDVKNMSNVDAMSARVGGKIKHLTTEVVKQNDNYFIKAEDSTLVPIEADSFNDRGKLFYMGTLRNPGVLDLEEPELMSMAMELKQTSNVPATSITAALKTANTMGRTSNRSFADAMKSNYSLRMYADYFGKEAVEKAYNLNHAEVKTADKQKAGGKVAKGQGKTTTAFNEAAAHNDAVGLIAEMISNRTGVTIDAKALTNADGTENKSTRAYLSGDSSTVTINRNMIDDVFDSLYHESFGEFMQKNNADGMEVLQDKILAYLQDNMQAKEYAELVEKYQRIYAEQADNEIDADKSQRAAANEMVNDTLFALFSTKEGMNDLIEWSANTMAENDRKSFLSCMKSMLDMIVDSIKSFLKTGSFNKAQRTMLEMSEKQAKELRQMVLDAMDVAIENRDAAAGAVQNTKNAKRKSVKIMDSEGRTLSEGQQKYFADNAKEFMKNGALKVYYHGSNNLGFSTIDTRKSDDGTSFFLTDSRTVASSYTKSNELFSLDAPMDFDTLASAIEDYTYGDFEAEEIDGKYVITELDGESVAFDTVKEAQEYFYDNIFNADGNEEASGIYPLYIHSVNPLVIEAAGAEWNELKPDKYSNSYSDVNITKSGDTYEIDYADAKSRYKHEILSDKELQKKFGLFASETQELKNVGTAYIEAMYFDAAGNRIPTTTRGYAEIAQAQGYDSVVFNNIVDNGEYTSDENAESQVVIVFDSNQVKSIYNENPTDNADVRKSVKVDYDYDKITTTHSPVINEHDPAIYFKGSDEEIEQYDNERKAVRTFFQKLIHSKDFAGLYYKKTKGKITFERYLTPSARQGVDWQLTYATNGEFTMHQDYNDVDDNIEIAHSGKGMNQLYAELERDIPDAGVDVEVTRKSVKVTDDARNSFKEYGEASPYAEELDEVEMLTSMLSTANTSFGGIKSIKQSALNRIANNIIKKYDANISTEELANNILQVFSLMNGNAVDLEYRNVMDFLLNIGDEVIANSNLKDPMQTETYNTVKANLKRYNIKLTETDKKELKHAYGSLIRGMGQMRKAGLNISSEGQSIDGLYTQIQQEIRELGGIAIEATADGDEIISIIDAMEALEPGAYLWEGATELDKAMSVVTDIMSGYYDEMAKGYTVNATKEANAEVERLLNENVDALEGKLTDAEKKAVELKAIKEAKKTLNKQFENYKKTKEAAYVNKMKSLVKELSDRNTSTLKGLVEGWEDFGVKVLSEKEIQETAKAKARAELNNYKAREERAKQMETIKRTGNRMIKWLTQPTDNQHVPEFLAEPLTGFLDAIDFLPVKANPDAKNTQNWLMKMQSLKDLMQKVERAEKNGEDSIEAYFAQGMLATEMVDKMERFISTYGYQQKISQLDAKGLKELSEIMSGLSAAINSMNKTYSNAQFENTADLARASVDEIAKLKKRKNHSKLVNGMMNFMRIDELEPIRYFEQLGPASRSVFDELREGFNQRTKRVKETADYMQQFKEKHGITDKEISQWGKEQHEFKFEGRTITLTTPQIMSLYELAKRDQAKAHIILGGIRAGDTELTQGGRFKYKVQSHQTRAVHIGASGLTEILNTLTDQQKTMADGMQQYMANECSKWGNNVSRKMFGYAKFGEKDYFPIKTDSLSRAVNASSDNVVSYYSIKNQGFTKALTPSANNALVLDDIFDVFTNHVVGMANYEGYTLPIADAMRWYNFADVYLSDVAEGKRRDVGNSVQMAIDEVMGSEGGNYFRQFIKDINGDYDGKSRGVELLDTFMGNYKAQAVMANVRVVVQQPTAIARAAEQIESKYLVKAQKDVTKAKQYAEKAQNNSQIAYWKAQGYYETLIGKSMKGIITGEESVRDKINGIAGAPAGLADDLTWGIMYRAAELKVMETQPDLKYDSKEFTEATVKIFEEIIDHTQVVDTLFHKSQFMRSQNYLKKSLSSFMAEPTKTYNMLFSAAENIFQAEKGSEARQKAINTAGRIARIFLFEQALNAVVTGIVDAARDDDKDKLDPEIILEKIKENFFDNLRLWNLVPMLKEFDNFRQGYSTTNYSMESLSTAFDTIKEIVKIADGSSTKTVYGRLYLISQAFSQLTGLPLASVIKEVKVFNNNVNDLWNGSDWVTTETKAKAKAKTKASNEAAEVYDSNDLGQIKSHLKQTYETTLEDETKTESDGYSAMRAELKEQFQRQYNPEDSGRSTVINRYKTLLKQTKKSDGKGGYRDLTDKEISNTIDKWINSQDTEEE